MQPARMDLEELLTDQSGVVTRKQALKAGLSERQLRGSGRGLGRLRQGVYADAVLLQGSAPERVALEVAAERLVTKVDLVAVAATAALLHDLPLLGAPPDRLQLAERKEERPRHHGASTTMTGDEVVEVHGVPVSSLPRTAVDVARRRGFAAGVVTADAVLRRDVTRAQLELVVQGRERWPGARHARRAVDFANALSESPLESLGRVRYDEHGLPAPALQVVLGDCHGPIGRVDQYWAAHRTVAEADGALKYMTAADLFAEKRREDRLREAGFEVVRYTWDEMLRTPEVVVVRILAAFARAARRAAAA